MGSIVIAIILSIGVAIDWWSGKISLYDFIIANALLNILASLGLIYMEIKKRS